jgi:hypothetical protein
VNAINIRLCSFRPHRGTVASTTSITALQIQASALSAAEEAGAAGRAPAEGMNGEESMPAPPDYGHDDSQRKTSVIEQCLAWGGEQRLRLLLTITVGGMHYNRAERPSVKFPRTTETR